MCRLFLSHVYFLHPPFRFFGQILHRPLWRCFGWTSAKAQFQTCWLYWQSPWLENCFCRILRNQRDGLCERKRGKSLEKQIQNTEANSGHPVANGRVTGSNPVAPTKSRHIMSAFLFMFVFYVLNCTFCVWTSNSKLLNSPMKFYSMTKVECKFIRLAIGNQVL